MSPHFGRCPCPSNLIQIESGPSLENLIKEIRYTGFYQANPGQVLKQSMYNNTFSDSPLGGDITPMAHGFDNPLAVGILPDIHPCGNSTEDDKCDTPNPENVVENLKEEASDESDFNICYIITGLLLLALIIVIICKLRDMYM